MPVRFSKGGEHHDRGDYSFYTRDQGSRDFARARRFGDDEADDGRTMSLVSSPLQVPLIGRRNVSPNRTTPQPQQQRIEDEEDFEEEFKNIQQRRRQSVENRRKIQQRNYDEFDDEPLDPLVPTFQPRFGRLSARSSEPRYASPSPRRPSRRQQKEQIDEFDDEEFEDDQRYQKQREEPRQQSRKQQREDEELQSMLNWRKRTKAPEPLVHTDFGYEVPPLRKRTDPALQQEDENIRSVRGYIAKRKQFAVEDDDDMQYFKNPNYQYRMLGMERPTVITDKDAEESLEKSRLDRAPMFDMKLRSHVVWEKMNVKFTCTVRGSPTPRVTWYKDMVPLEPSLCSPGKFKISKQFGLHTLEICRASIEDSGTYRVSLQNRKGEISSYATLIVRRYDGGRMGVMDVKSGYNMKKPTDYPDVQGLNIPDKRPHAGAIEVREYDELPETEAARHFKSQLENLDFDVKKLIKEAKLEKDITSFDSAVGDSQGNVSKTRVTFSDEIAFDPRDTAPQKVTLDATTKTSDAFVNVTGNESNGVTIEGDVNKTGTSEINIDIQDQAKKTGMYKVAIQVNVKNETRRDSFDTIEKTLEMERKREAEKKKELEPATGKIEDTN